MKLCAGQAFLHVAAATCLLAATVALGVFEGVLVEVGYEHYAEARVPHLPVFVTMPFNSLVNLAYGLLGLYWLQSGSPGGPATQVQYLKDVFAAMALLYGPVQWLRIASQARAAALLDQWVTLPIFAWPVAWCLCLERGWRPRLLLAVEGLSLCSYGAVLLHPRGFEAALGAHILAAVAQALCVQRHRGSPSSGAYLALAVLSCSGFVGLKLYDHELARCPLFRRLTGHFWSKVCDVLQFHFAFLFLMSVSARPGPLTEGKAR
ncbi:transmembrane protein 187 [Erinaceus europaeus]|uniref:Transmembrane protein 187 n=1 Tax=Erinaceus europaeus TaxID=9365 RepID=A0A1S3AHE4_ERIEU|nr:transmembrane protein 187 [Erinaceus europaeus]XP_060039294.1 transmembrane protein 187 [Erinaceus europaeus]XP_060039295.1 transmembrane protein 187 [Erinaceus europaeus]